jgi:DNA-binding NarL/FixJ family response regulator
MVRILIADDSDLVRSKLAAELSTHGDWTVCGEALNGRKAVLQALDLRPDLILLDFSMPMLSGLQAAEEILKLLPSVPVVLYTLYDDPQMRAEAKKIGICKVIPKASSTNLVAELEEILGKQHEIGPLSVSDEYILELDPPSGEDSQLPPGKPDDR